MIHKERKREKRILVKNVPAKPSNMATLEMELLVKSLGISRSNAPLHMLRENFEFYGNYDKSNSLKF